MKSILLLIMITASINCHAGPRSDGGTDRLVEYFSAVAADVLANVYFEPSDRVLIETALAESEIISVRELIDPRTGQVLTSPQLVAWGSPGKIQLKQASLDAPNAESFEKLVNNKSAMAHIVIHELIRSSGNAGDNNFQISIGKYHLDRLPGKDYSSRPTTPNLPSQAESNLARIYVDTNSYESNGRATIDLYAGQYITVLSESQDDLRREWLEGYVVELSMRSNQNEPIYVRVRKEFVDRIPNKSAASNILISMAFEVANEYSAQWDSTMQAMRDHHSCEPQARISFHTFGFSNEYAQNLSSGSFYNYLNGRLVELRQQYFLEYDKLYRRGTCDTPWSKLGM